MSKYFNTARDLGSYCYCLFNLKYGTLALGSLLCSPPLSSQSGVHPILLMLSYIYLIHI